MMKKTETSETAVADETPRETVAEFLARGGKITKLEPKKSKGYAEEKMRMAGGKPNGKERARRQEEKFDTQLAR